MKFTVWAPVAKSVDIVLGDDRRSLERAADGYWDIELDAGLAAHGYRYSIDGGLPVPDPRSRWQPDGVHGSSHVVDSAQWRHQQATFDAKPLADAVLYEMHIGTFTPEGTYAAALGKLDYLVELGVTHLELMPVATFPGQHGWGYDGVFLYAPLPAYGTPDDLAHFVGACHQRGLAVLLDVVYNHLGPDGNYLGMFGPYFTDHVKTPWGEAVNYDGPHSDGVRAFVIDNALMWLDEYGFDGLRLDAVHAIFGFEAVHVLEELASAVRKRGLERQRNWVLIAESDLNDPRLVRPAIQGGYGLHAHWADDFHHAVHGFFTGERNGYYVDFNGLADVANALAQGYVYQGQFSQHRQRRHGRSPRGVTPDQLVISAQNHDQIGNRAQGERLSMLLSDWQLKAIAALTLLSPFVPMLFQGEEWGARSPFLYFTDHQDEELAKLVVAGRVKEFSAFSWAGEVPNPQAAATFQRSKLDWSEASAAPHAELLQWYRRLIELRRGRAPDARRRAKVKWGSDWLRVWQGSLLSAFNFTAQTQRISMPAGDWDLVLGTHEADAAGVPPHATQVFQLRAPERQSG